MLALFVEHNYIVKYEKTKECNRFRWRGFIGGHLGKRLKDDGCHVRIADIKNHEFWAHSEICHEFIKCDLTDPKAVELVITEGCDEVYQLAADMGGGMDIFLLERMM